MLSRSHIVSVGLFSDPWESTVGKKISMDAAAETSASTRGRSTGFRERNQLRAYRVGNKLVRVDLDDVEKLLVPITPVM